MLKKVGNFYLLGTAHVSKESAKEIVETISSLKPEVVAIELDIGRLRSLMQKGSEKKGEKGKVKKKVRLGAGIREIGFGGYVFAKVAGFMQEKIAKALGVESGIDMKTAFVEARKEKIPTALIDQEIKVTLSKFSKIPFFRKVRLMGNLVFKSFKKKYRQDLNIDLSKGIPDYETLKKIISIVRAEAPELYEILIEERNRVMCENLRKLSENHSGPILAVVGAGHLPGMIDILEKVVEVPAKLEFSFSYEV